MGRGRGGRGGRGGGGGGTAGGAGSRVGQAEYSALTRKIAGLEHDMMLTVTQGGSQRTLQMFERELSRARRKLENL